MSLKLTLLMDIIEVFHLSPESILLHWFIKIIVIKLLRGVNKPVLISSKLKHSRGNNYDYNHIMERDIIVVG